IVTSRIKQPDVKIDAVRCGLPTVAGLSAFRPCSLNLWWLSLMRIVDERQKSFHCNWNSFALLNRRPLACSPRASVFAAYTGGKGQGFYFCEVHWIVRCAIIYAVLASIEFRI